MKIKYGPRQTRESMDNNLNMTILISQCVMCSVNILRYVWPLQNRTRKRLWKVSCVDPVIETTLLSIGDPFQGPSFYELINHYWMVWFKKNMRDQDLFKKQVDMGMWIIARISSAYQFSGRVFLKYMIHYK